MKHSTKLVIDNHQLKKAGYEAYIYYASIQLAEDEFDEDILVVIESEEEHHDLLGRPYNKIEEKFTDMLRAMDWVTSKSEELVKEELRMAIKRGKIAASELDEISVNGFKL